MAGLLHQVTVIGLLSLFYQGMEEVKRQFGKHIAVEPEWEAGFTLQIQLRHILAMFQDWCSSDVRSLAIYLLKNKSCPREMRGVNCCNQLLPLCPLRMRSCCLHIKSATKSWCNAITSPSIGNPPTTTCASTSSMFVRTKCLSSLSAYICPSPDYWLVGELIFATLSNLLYFFLSAVNLICTLWFLGLYVLLCRTGAIARLDNPVSDIKKPKTLI